MFAPATPPFDARREEIEQALYQNAPSSYRAYFAEYPSEAAFEHCLRYGEVSLGDGDIVSTHVTLTRGSEWQYDYSTKERAENLDVPTKAFVEMLRLHWDQHSGWLDEHGALAAFAVEGETRSALFVRRTLLDKYLRDAGRVLYARQYINRGTSAGYGPRRAPSLDVDVLIVYRPGHALTVLGEKRELFEPEPSDEG